VTETVLPGDTTGEPLTNTIWLGYSGVESSAPSSPVEAYDLEANNENIIKME
jgi:hypothetical protein